MANKLLKISPAILGLLMTSCASLSQSDSYCSAYKPLLGQRGVGSITTTAEIKNRIAANERTYLCNCPGNEVLKARLCKT